jgi:hypothetical protein
MGTGSYIGGHTKIFISDGGTKWEVSDRPAARSDDSTRERWDEEVGVETGRRLRRVSKEGRSFLSMCAVAFRNDALTDHHPKPPSPLQREVKLAGGNKKWIANDPARLGLFEQFYKRSEPKRQQS